MVLQFWNQYGVYFQCAPFSCSPCHRDYSLNYHFTKEDVVCRYERMGKISSCHGSLILGKPLHAKKNWEVESAASVRGLLLPTFHHLFDCSFNNICCSHDSCTHKAS